MQNYILYSVPVIYLAFILYRNLSLKLNKDIKNISAEEAHQLMKTNKNLLIIDVRTKQEYKSGHITGSKSLPVSELSARISEFLKYKDQPVLVHCASGSRSSSAVRILIKNGFNDIYHMKRGLMGWNYGLK